MKQQKILSTTINIFILQDKQTSKLKNLEVITKYVQNDYREPNQGVHAHISEQYSEVVYWSWATTYYM